MDKNQLKYYTSILKNNEILLLKSDDAYFQNHYNNSPLNVMTNFSGTAGEAIINKKGEITLFVDTRYHLLAPKQIYKKIKLVKMDLGESFLDSITKLYPKNTILYVPNDILLSKYLNFNKYFDLRTYKLDEKYLQNNDFNSRKSIFLIDASIEKNTFEFKINKLKEKYKNVDRMLVFDLDEISYLTNLRSFQNKYSSNFKSILYIDFKNSNHELFIEKIPNNKIKIYSLNFRKLEEFPNFIKSKDYEIHLNPAKITLNNFLLIKKPKELNDNKISLFASIKTKSVLEHLKSSSLKLDIAIYNFKNKLKAGFSEVDLVNIFEKELIKAGAQCPSFKTLLAIDENSASIHYSQYDKNKVLSGENILLLDCGGYYEGGYATDITRTFYFGCYPKPIHKKIYTNTLRAFIKCFTSKELNAKKMDLIARKLLSPFEKEGFYFNHGLGHGIGTSVHQAPPTLNNYSTDIIKPYQTYSIEPGLYGKNKENIEFGIRIENCVYNDINYERISLSNFPFEEVLIDYNILNTNEIEFIKNWQNNWQNIINNR